MLLSQLLISDSDLLQLHSKEQNISKYRGAVYTKAADFLLWDFPISFNFHYSKKKMGSVNFAASLHLFFITPKVQITVGLHWQSTTPQWGGKKETQYSHLPALCLSMRETHTITTLIAFNDGVCWKPFHGVRVLVTEVRSQPNQKLRYWITSVFWIILQQEEGKNRIIYNWGKKRKIYDQLWNKSKLHWQGWNQQHVFLVQMHRGKWQL